MRGVGQGDRLTLLTASSDGHLNPSSSDAPIRFTLLWKSLLRKSPRSASWDFSWNKPVSGCYSRCSVFEGILGRFGVTFNSHSMHPDTLPRLELWLKEGFET